MKELNNAKDFLDRHNMNKENSYNTGYRQNSYIIDVIASFNFMGNFQNIEINSINCIYFDSDFKMIYVGCKNGKIYVLNFDGIIQYIIDFKKNNNYFYGFSSIQRIKSDILIYDGHYIHILNSNQYIKNIQKIDYRGDTGCKLKWYSQGFIFYSSQYISIFNHKGDLIDIIIFNKKIKSFAIENDIVIIESTKREYIFKLP